MDFDALLPAARRDALAVADLEIGRERHQPQRVARDDQPPIDGLAIFAEPRRDVHRVAEIGELAFGVAAFADNDGTGVQPGAKGRRNAESAS